MRRWLGLTLGLVVFLALSAVIVAVVAWLLNWLAPSSTGWLDENVNPAGRRVLPFAAWVIVAIVGSARIVMGWSAARS